MEDQIQKQISALTAELHNVPPETRAKIQTLAGEFRTQAAGVKEAGDRIRESLDQLRLMVKYLVFDLEATRRENAKLRKLLQAGSAGKDASED